MNECESGLSGLPYYSHEREGYLDKKGLYRKERKGWIADCPLGAGLVV